MKHMLDISEFLVACWALVDRGNRIPTSHGILDRALKEAVDNDACPSWVRDGLNFVDSRIGLQCIELPALLDWAQRAQLTSAPNPSYQSAQIEVSKEAAARLVQDLGVDVEDARHWGVVLHQYAESARNSSYPDHVMAIEDY
ncbi:MAG: hypothetical protein OXC91_06950 [Rhodobacteraceae bacterium]|nr:hypothetical protein [Paracoccaceae bacterium]